MNFSYSSLFGPLSLEFPTRPPFLFHSLSRVLFAEDARRKLSSVDTDKRCFKWEIMSKVRQKKDWTALCDFAGLTNG